MEVYGFRPLSSSRDTYNLYGFIKHAGLMLKPQHRARLELN